MRWCWLAVKLENIKFPVMAVTFANDTIVPAASASPLIDVISSESKLHLHLPGGHVGAVVSKHAAKSLWPNIAEFYAAHDEPQVSEVPVVAPAKVESKTPPAVVQRLGKPATNQRLGRATPARH